MRPVRRQHSLDQVWDQQLAYNQHVINQQDMSSSDWMINYILGTMTELTELLDETNWRQHRVARINDFGPNVAEELADITKYVFSMWQIMGYTPLDMLSAMKEKGDILEQLQMQELPGVVKGQNILMLDLDGVVADFRKGFMQWVSSTKWKDILTIKEEDIGLHMDINNGWNYKAYNQAKIEFERDGGYSNLPVLKEVKMAVNSLYRIGWHVIVYTARPYSTYKRIWGDTWIWLKAHNIEVNELHFGYDERVVAASELARDNFVVAIEDDPTLIKRYVGCKIPIFIYPQPYNEAIPLTEGITHAIRTTDQHWEISSRIDQLTRRT